MFVAISKAQRIETKLKIANCQAHRNFKLTGFRHTSLATLDFKLQCASKCLSKKFKAECANHDIGGNRCSPSLNFSSTRLSGSIVENDKVT